MSRSPQVHFRVSDAERQRIDEIAEAYGLDSGTFSRLLVIGAMSKGVVDTLLAVGSKRSDLSVRRRAATTWKDWKGCGPGRVERGEWVMIKRNPRTDWRQAHDRATWWRLTNSLDSSVDEVLAFSRQEAQTVATAFIERYEAKRAF